MCPGVRTGDALGDASDFVGKLFRFLFIAENIEPKTFAHVTPDILRAVGFKAGDMMAISHAQKHYVSYRHFRRALIFDA